MIKPSDIQPNNPASSNNKPNLVNNTTSKRAPDILQGSSAKSKNTQKLIELVAPTNMTVVVIGESGTGKEIVARLIHRTSERKDGPFVPVDCGALPQDLAASELFGHVKGSFTEQQEIKRVILKWQMEVHFFWTKLETSPMIIK